MGNKKKFLYILLVLNLFFGNALVVHAQLQTFNFSANDADSYQCFDPSTGENLTTPDPQTKVAKATVSGPDDFGNYFCCVGQGVGGNPVAATGECPTGMDKILAQIKPPALQQLEVWFVRILYAIWGLVASLSFLFLVKLGYEYVISRGDPMKITEIRKRIVNYVIGFALVFLAVPILSTVFRLMGINSNAQCYNVSMPGFRFFYANLCTDPKGIIAEKFAAAPCQELANGSAPEGIVCKGTSYEGQTVTCGIQNLASVSLTCDVQTGDTAPTWCRTSTLFGFCSSSCNPSQCAQSTP